MREECAYLRHETPDGIVGDGIGKPDSQSKRDGVFARSGT